MLHVGDCLDVMKGMDDNSVDLVMTSPPYEDTRTYGIDFALRDQAWVDWAVERFVECSRVCKGAVVWVVNGKQRNYRWSATPALLMADLHRRGITLRKPPAFHRVGIPGSGSYDWFRDDYEFCVCATKGGRLPWSDNTALGHPVKHKPGGAMSHRTKNGARRKTPSMKERRENGVKGNKGYKPPTIANPGNVISLKVGGKHMGSDCAHENEAPYPEKLCEYFIRSCCPPGGVVFDPFCGSGTTCAVAVKTGRYYIGCDVRSTQVAITHKRLSQLQNTEKEHPRC